MTAEAGEKSENRVSRGREVVIPRDLPNDPYAAYLKLRLAGMQVAEQTPELAEFLETQKPIREGFKSEREKILAKGGIPIY